MVAPSKSISGFCQACRVAAAMIGMTLVFVLLPPQAVLAGTWIVTGSLHDPRGSHTATLLKNGKVLVAGGWNGSADLNSAEIYDPVGKTWGLTGSLATARDSHTATLLNDGKVLVAGGWDINYTVFNSAELYDTNQWTTAAQLNAGRALHTDTLLTNGKVLVTGGWGGSTDLSSAELYDPVGKSWATAAPLSTAREYHTATLLNDGRVLVVGGQYTPNGFDYSVLNSAELYDPGTNRWTAAAPLTTGRAFHTATLLTNGKVLVAGGYDGGTALSSAELYDPAQNSWSPAGDLLPGRLSATATLLRNGQVLVAGGYNYNEGALTSAGRYTPATNSWSATGNLANGRYGHTATLLPNGKVLAAGGYNLVGSDISELDSAEIYQDGSSLAPVILFLLGD